MLAEHIKAINKFAEWERSDPVWVGIVNNKFPLDFAWPIGWLPWTHGKYAPATGEITQRPMTDLLACLILCACFILFMLVSFCV
jgi:hypothetical protein